MELFNKILILHLYKITSEIVKSSPLYKKKIFYAKEAFSNWYMLWCFLFPSLLKIPPFISDEILHEVWVQVLLLLLPRTLGKSPYIQCLTSNNIREKGVWVGVWTLWVLGRWGKGDESLWMYTIGGVRVQPTLQRDSHFKIRKTILQRKVLRD